MAGGNKGFAGMVTEGREGGVEPRRPPRTGILGARENRLAELAAGTVVTRVHEAVDPAVCRIWAGHNRDYAALNEQVCADLIEGLRAQGRQEVPAIVRRIGGDPAYRFEVICGARRHWSVAWLRSHNYPEFKFVVEPRELSDEEAFRVADLENRSRKDLSDYERATDYARAVATYYGGSQQRMAERLQVTKSWLSRYLDLARLPPEVLTCFGSSHVVGISHAAALAPVLGRPREHQQVMTRAATLIAEQRQRSETGLSPLKPAEIVSRLLRAAADTKPGKSNKHAKAPVVVVRDGDGQPLIRVVDESRADVTFLVPKARIADYQTIGEAVAQHLKSLGKHR